MSPDPGGRPGGNGDVAAELRALQRAVREVDDIARESAGVLSETAPKVVELEEHVAKLRGTVAALVADAEDTPAEDPALTAAKAALGMRPEPPGPWCWPLLDADQAAAAWDSLARWVGEVLVPTYELTRGDLLDCWPRHPRIVAELSWLRHAYLDAHARGAVPAKAADWHLRHLPWVLATIRGVARPNPNDPPLCGPGHHLTHPDEDDRYLAEKSAGEPATLEQWHDAWLEAGVADLAGGRRAPA
jgi:hypothetical protein